MRLTSLLLNIRSEFRSCKTYDGLLRGRSKGKNQCGSGRPRGGKSEEEIKRNGCRQVGCRAVHSSDRILCLITEVYSHLQSWPFFSLTMQSPSLTSVCDGQKCQQPERQRCKLQGLGVSLGALPDLDVFIFPKWTQSCVQVQFTSKLQSGLAGG